MTTVLRPVLDIGLTETAALLSLGFSDYIVPVQFNLASLLHLVAQDGLDVGACRVILSDGEPAGVALIARRGWTSRLAGMAIVPGARGRHVGRAAMALLLAEARARGERQMVLEVIEGNAAAIALYERRGFVTRRRLLSFAGQPPGEPSEGLEQMDIRLAAAWITSDGLPELPWQVSGESVALLGPPAEAWRLGDAMAVLSNPEQPVAGLRALIVQQAARGQGQATALLRALAARYPGKEWRVPALCPEEAAPFFRTAGFTPGALSQLQMICRL